MNDETSQGKYNQKEVKKVICRSSVKNRGTSVLARLSKLLTELADLLESARMFPLCGENGNRRSFVALFTTTLPFSSLLICC